MQQRTFRVESSSAGLSGGHYQHHGACAPMAVAGQAATHMFRRKKKTTKIRFNLCETTPGSAGAVRRYEAVRVLAGGEEQHHIELTALGRCG